MKENFLKMHEVVEQNRGVLIDASQKIWEHPELGYQEHFAMETLTNILSDHGFEIEKGIGGMATAFRAVKKSSRPGSSIGFIAEYDALVQLGHACGHNLFCCASVGAAIAYGQMLEETGGSVSVIGTPAEEGGVPNPGGKVVLAREGYFDGIDAAMMCHAENETVIERKLVASVNISVEFKGLASHAGGAPEKGINALQAGVLMIENINAVRQQMVPGDLINGIITDGGTGQGTIPDLCKLVFSARANTMARLKKMMDKVNVCAQAAAMVTGCTYTVSASENIYADTMSNHVLGTVFAGVLDEMGVPYRWEDSRGYAWDLGNVTYQCPTLGAYIKIGEESLVGHTPEFRSASNSSEGQEAFLMAAKVMADTAYVYATDESIRQKAQEEFVKTRQIEA